MLNLHLIEWILKMSLINWGLSEIDEGCICVYINAHVSHILIHSYTTHTLYIYRIRNTHSIVLFYIHYICIYEAWG